MEGKPEKGENINRDSKSDIRRQKREEKKFPIASGRT